MRTLNLWLITAAAAGLLAADTVTYTVSESMDTFLYDFTLTNTGSTGGTLFDLFLHTPTDIANIETASIGTPVGWGDTHGGQLFFGPDTSPSTSFIEWAADFSGMDDVQIGDSLEGFSFTASQPVGTPITFALNGSTDFAEAQTVSTPEPTSLVPFAGLLVAMVHRIIRARKR